MKLFQDAKPDARNTGAGGNLVCRFGKACVPNRHGFMKRREGMLGNDGERLLASAFPLAGGRTGIL